MSTRTPLHRAPVATSVRHLRSICRRVSFWSAVVLPFVSLSLFLTGLETTSETAAFLGLLVASVLALAGGRGYAQ